LTYGAGEAKANKHLTSNSFLAACIINSSNNPYFSHSDGISCNADQIDTRILISMPPTI
ncbi:hypothetical protein CRM22_000346, partial [Opisthorchis felineus]